MENSDDDWEFDDNEESLEEWLRRLGYDQSANNIAGLTDLYMGSANIESLHRDFGLLQNLENLYLMDNNLSTLPDSFYQLRNLKKLHLSHNKFDTIPNVLLQLPNLEMLFMDDNKITSLPENMFNMTGLKILTLYDNPMNGPIPPSLREWLSSIQLRGVQIDALDFRQPGSRTKAIRGRGRHGEKQELFISVDVCSIM